MCAHLTVLAPVGVAGGAVGTSANVADAALLCLRLAGRGLERGGDNNLGEVEEVTQELNALVCQAPVEEAPVVCLVHKTAGLERLHTLADAKETKTQGKPQKNKKRGGGRGSRRETDTKKEKRREENENRERWRGRGREGENVSQNHHLGARCLFEVCALERRVRLNRSTHLEGLDDVQVGDLLELGVAGSVEVLLGDHDAVLEQLHVHLLAAGLGDQHL